MRKILIVFLMTLTIGLSLGLHIFGATESINYDFIISDGFKFDLDTGDYVADSRYATTNRIAKLDDELILSTDTYHHIVMFGTLNTYLGYYNSPYTTYQNDKYLGDEDTLITFPENVKSFAIVIYKSLNNVPIEALNDLTLNQVFNDYNVITDPEITGLGSWLPVNASQNTVTYDEHLLLDGLVGSYSYVSAYRNVLTTTYSYWTVFRAYVSSSTRTAIQVKQGSTLITDTPSIDAWDDYYVSVTGVSSYNINVTYDNDTLGDEIVKVTYAYAVNKTLAGITGITDEQLYDYFTQWRENDDANNEQYTELNGLTLNEVFDDGQLFLNNTFDNNVDYWINIWTNDYSTLSWENGYSKNEITTPYIANGIGQTISQLNHYYYVRFEYKVNMEVDYVANHNYGSVDYIPTESKHFNPIINEWHSYSDISLSLASQIKLIAYKSSNLPIGFIMNVDNTYVYDLTSLGIDTLTKEQMDYYYNVYQDNKAQDFYTLHLAVGSYDLLNPYFVREEITPNPTDPDSLIDNILDNAGINDAEGKTYLSVGLIIGLVILLALFKVPFPLIFIIEGALVVTLSFIGWLPMWLPILIVLLVVLWLLKNFLGGGESESD
jgi:hypothetical protein